MSFLSIFQRMKSDFRFLRNVSHSWLSPTLVYREFSNSQLQTCGRNLGVGRQKVDGNFFLQVIEIKGIWICGSDYKNLQFGEFLVFRIIILIKRSFKDQSFQTIYLFFFKNFQFLIYPKSNLFLFKIWAECISISQSNYDRTRSSSLHQTSSPSSAAKLQT